MKTALVIAVGVGMGLVLAKLLAQPTWTNPFASPGEPKGGAADLPLEDRKAVQTERL